MSGHQAVPADWRRQQEKSHLAILKLMVWISLTFGRRVGRVVLYGIAAYYVLFAAAARRASVCWQIANAKFLSPVGPGETLSFMLEVREGGAISFSVRAGGRAVASGSLTPPTP